MSCNTYGIPGINRFRFPDKRQGAYLQEFHRAALRLTGEHLFQWYYVTFLYFVVKEFPFLLSAKGVKHLTHLVQDSFGLITHSDSNTAYCYETLGFMNVGLDVNQPLFKAKSYLDFRKFAPQTYIFSRYMLFFKFVHPLDVNEAKKGKVREYPGEILGDLWSQFWETTKADYEEQNTKIGAIAENTMSHLVLKLAETPTKDKKQVLIDAIDGYEATLIRDLDARSITSALPTLVVNAINTHMQNTLKAWCP